MGVLDDILSTKRTELASLRHHTLPTPPPLRSIDLARGTGQPLRLLAELKRRSPSAGRLSVALTARERAEFYQAAGISMMSVLCDATFFGGSYQDLGEVRSSCQLPLLCKEFIIDPIQLDWARAFGADAVLLIVRCLRPETLHELHAEALARGLTPLVEVASWEEARLALEIGAKLVGINARDLDTLAIDSARAAQVVSRLPDHIVRIHLSGLKTPDDVARVRDSKADGALIGEALMRADDPRTLLAAFVEASRPPS